MKSRAALYRAVLICAVLLLAAGVTLLVLHFTVVSHQARLSVSELRGMQSSGGTYHSINRWKTEENTDFGGVPVSSLLSRYGVTLGAQQVKFVAPDGYFWPALGSSLTVAKLGTANPQGLSPIVACRMAGKPLDPPPEGTGPLRLVLPQYTENEVNKPGWVSNLRLIELVPLPKGMKAPDARKIPEDQLWIYGAAVKVPVVPLWLPVFLLALGAALLAVALLVRSRWARETAKTSGSAAGAALLVTALVAGACLAHAPPTRASTAVVFSNAELRAMPAFAGHYTFLKQLPPYTYYEEDYKGVALSTLLEEKMRLAGGASKVVVRATDDYLTNLTLDQVNRIYPNGLKAIIAYEKGGAPLSSGDDAEGPLRLIVPQEHPGNKASGGDPNTPLCERMVYSMEVQPSDGVAAPSKGSVPSGSLALYGSVDPAPAPAPTPTPQPADNSNQQQPAATDGAQPASSTTGRPLMHLQTGNPRAMMLAVATEGVFPMCPWPVGYSSLWLYRMLVLR